MTVTGSWPSADEHAVVADPVVWLDDPPLPEQPGPEGMAP